jgi:mono/diheme cytochrome c family protein
MLAIACTTTQDPMEAYEEVARAPVINAPAAVGGGQENQALVDHGRYLVELVGCPACHANGALVGEPDFDDWLSGSDVGIAYSNPMEYDEPGVVFPSNLTPDPKTGIGLRSDDELADAIREGANRHGRNRILAMPWLAYSKLSEADTAAIVAYLRNLPPVVHPVPDAVAPGSATDEPFVYFGIYRNRR